MHNSSMRKTSDNKASTMVNNNHVKIVQGKGKYVKYRNFELSTGKTILPTKLFWRIYDVDFEISCPKYGFLSGHLIYLLQEGDPYNQRHILVLQT